MTKENTPMQELIEAMNESPLMFHSALSLISILKSVEKEKQVVEDAWYSGAIDTNAAHMDLAQDYYNQKFKQ